MEAPIIVSNQNNYFIALFYQPVYSVVYFSNVIIEGVRMDRFTG